MMIGNDRGEFHLLNGIGKGSKIIGTGADSPFLWCCSEDWTRAEQDHGSVGRQSWVVTTWDLVYLSYGEES